MYIYIYISLSIYLHAYWPNLKLFLLADFALYWRISQVHIPELRGYLGHTPTNEPADHIQ